MRARGRPLPLVLSSTVSRSWRTARPKPPRWRTRPIAVSRFRCGMARRGPGLSSRSWRPRNWPTPRRPVSDCLPYGRTPLADSVACSGGRYRRAGPRLPRTEPAGALRDFRRLPARAVVPAVDAGSGLRAGKPVLRPAWRHQRVAELRAADEPGTRSRGAQGMRRLAGDLLPSAVDWHVVLYTYMASSPTSEGAQDLLSESVDIAVRARNSHREDGQRSASHPRHRGEHRRTRSRGTAGEVGAPAQHVAHDGAGGPQ